MKSHASAGRLIALVLLGVALISISWVCTRAFAQAPGEPLRGAPISYQSDGLKITGLLSKPRGAGPFPIVIVNHGGFEPAKSVSGFLDLFASHGFVAVASDYRGCGNSEGNRELAKGEVGDVLEAMRFARTLPYADAKRVAVWGFSHGAALALLAASRDNSIRAVVAVQGPVEMADAWRHWVENQSKPGIKPLAGISSLVGGSPEQVPAAWRERSALYVADKIKCPVLLIYSDADHDDAVPTDQGTRMDAALRASGNSATKLLLLPKANHGLDAKTWGEISGPMLEFIQQHTSQ
jgi:dipeptidyl aminopeptidase/acylaminoacyl peptidase